MEYQICNKKIIIEERTLQGTAYSNTGLDHPDIYSLAIKELETFGDDDVFIDAGANIGLFTLLINKGKVFAFEPTPETYNKLMANCKLNPEKKIFAINRGLYSSEENYDLVIHSLFDGCNKTEARDDGKYCFTTIDGWCEKLLGEKEKVKLIKIDVEGSDLEVLRGAEKVIEEFHPLIIVEVNHMPNKDDVRNFLINKGYVFEERDGNDWVARWKG